MNYLKIYIPLLLAGLLALPACNLEETNLNPNDPLDVPMEVLLPPALEAAASEMAEDAAVYAGIFAQYFTGVDNQALPVERYLLDESFNMNPIWQDFYNTPLNTLHMITGKAAQQKSPHYAGVAKVMMALSLGTVTSLWGDVPYSDAFQGAENPNPRYDTQAQLYAAIQQLLDEAIADLDAPESVFSPGADDVIYNGDLGKWRKAAHALKARYYMHTIKRDDQAAAKALDATAQAFAGPEDDFVYTYGFSAAEQNPWFLYFKNTPYVQVDDFFVDLIKNAKDPREKQLIKRTFGINRVGEYYAGEFAPIPLMTFAEMKLLEAEARLRSGQPGAQVALQEGLTAHVEAVINGTITADSIANFAQRVGTFSGDFGTDLATIATQQYIAHFTQIEGWTDFRRTGLPALPANLNGDNPQNPGGAIPRRFIYPQNERLFNANFPASNPNLQDRFWWDE
ncbi:MAG: SusD/RagB family nutrient-binding outer membrane lipoprotein [Lewinellaceae bacterium]|nr:SusD/RagB family nutrient-binding outer membrane lipoprotein [Saprospiraceae bacterium]MCB9337416.1 SusD/RagB family nutrient-binding outer membrane lipoprotein [Lewinellaceae bacterium]